MRELHVVTVSEDGRHVLLAGRRGSTTATFRVALDDRLAAAVRGDLPRPGDEPAGPDLTPKQIQARLRAGESAEAIALSAGVPVTRVERFAGPVQGEMARVIDAARSSYLVRGRLGRSAVPLGKAVDAALAQSPSLRPDSIEWETRRDEDGAWLVTVTWFARARSRVASWRYELAGDLLTAVDTVSATLGHHDPDAPARKPPRSTAATAAPAKPAAKKAAAKKSSAGKASRARKAPAKKAAAKKSPAKKSPAKKAPAKKVVAKRAPAKKAPAKKAPVVPRKSRALTVVPDPVPRRTRVTAAERDGVTTRAAVPGWAEVLLGTTPGPSR